MNSFPHTVEKQEIQMQFTSKWKAENYAEKAIENGCKNVRMKEVTIHPEKPDTTVFIYPIHVERYVFHD